MGNGGYVDRRLLLILPYAAWLLTLVAAPFAFILAISLAERHNLRIVEFHWTASAYRELLDPLYLQVFGRTVAFAGAHTFVTLLAAYPVAFYLSRLPRAQASIYLTLLLVPFWTNYLVRLLAFMDILRLQPFGLQ